METDNTNDEPATTGTQRGMFGDVSKHKNVENVIRFFLNFLPPRGTESVVDIGAGRTAPYRGMLRKRCDDNYTSVDIRPGPRVDVVCDIIAGSPFEDDQFDYAWCSETLEHVPQDKQREFVDEVCRIAKNVVWTFPLPSNPSFHDDPGHNEVLVDMYDYRDRFHVIDKTTTTGRAIWIFGRKDRDISVDMAGIDQEGYEKPPPKGRDRLDRYYTPDALARSCVACVPLRDGDRVLEPSAGGGAFLRALAGAQPTLDVSAVDIDPNAPAAKAFPVEQIDFLSYRNNGEPFDWVIGNPPYNNAERHVRHALTMSHGVAMLLRLAFMESLERVALWKGIGGCLREVRVLAARPSFTKGGTDATAYGWFVWHRRHRGPARIVPGWEWKEK